MVKVNNFMNFAIQYFEGARGIMLLTGWVRGILCDYYQYISEYFTKNISKYIHIVKNNPSQIEVEKEEWIGTELTLLDGSKVFIPRGNEINKTSLNILTWKDVMKKSLEKREIYNDEVLNILRKYNYL